MRRYGKTIVPILAVIALIVATFLSVQHFAPAAVAIGGSRTAKAHTTGVTKGLFVKLSAAGVIDDASASTDKIVGVCERTADANQITSYAPMGTQAVVTSGEAIAVGDLVTSGTGGKAFVMATEGPATHRIAGVALTAASGADEDVTVILAPGAVGEINTIATPTDANGTIEIGVPNIITFLVDAAETLEYTVPTGYDMIVVDVVGWKDHGAGAHADDDWTLKNNDGTPATICLAELNGIADGAKVTAWTGFVEAEREIEDANGLQLVANENAANGADGRVIVMVIFKAAD